MNRNQKYRPRKWLALQLLPFKVQNMQKNSNYNNSINVNNKNLYMVHIYDSSLLQLYFIHLWFGEAGH